MATPSAPNNFYVQQGNRQVFLSWDISAGAGSYSIQKSTDPIFGAYVTYTTTSNNYLDTVVSVGTQYYYRVAGVVTPATYSSATMTLSGQPSVGQTFIIANTTFTAGTSNSGTTFNIGGTTTDTAANIASVVGIQLNYSVSTSSTNNVITFYSWYPGTEGNGLQFSSSLSNASISQFSGGTNGSTGNYTTAQSIIPTPTAEMSLGQIRLLAQQRADRVNSNFVTLPEWNSYINQSLYELYDLLITADEEYYVATPVSWISDGTTFQYPLPNGALTFTNGIDGTTSLVAAPFYKLKGVDLGLQTAQNAYVTINKFNFIDRNRFVYPNTASTIYGVFNLQYRLLGDKIEFIPTPSAGQRLRMWYIPRLPQLLQDTDITTSSVSGWIEYVIVDAAIKALQKEESDVSVLMAQKQMLKQRIEETAVNRDTGMPDKVSDVRQNGYWGSMSGGYGWNGPMGGF